MLKLTRTGIGLLTRQYRSVLRKCWLINVGLWQTVGDAVSKAVSVPARLIASLMSGGTMNGEAFNVLDEILLNRLFERKLASLTAIGLVVAAAAIPNVAVAEETASTVHTERLINPEGEELTLKGDTFQNITMADEDGGAVYNAGIMNFDAVTFDSNSVTSDKRGFGGAIYNVGTIGHITDSLFTNNSADRKGGAIYNTGIINDIRADFIENKTTVVAAIMGGSSIWNEGTIDNYTGVIKNNSAAQDAAGIYSVNSGKITITDSLFINNSAPHGAAIYAINGGRIDVYNSIFDSNTTTNRGGAAFSNHPNSLINFYDSTAINNTSVLGGAMYIQDNAIIGVYAQNANTIFRNNKDNTGYNDVAMTFDTSLHLNAAQNKSIDFGGSITGNGAISINNGYNSSSTGGDYIFRNTVSGATMNLYNGAEVRLRGMYQEDESYTTGILKNTTTTITGSGNIISSIDNNANSGAADTQYHQSNDLGALTFNSGANLILRFDVNATGSGDLFTASSVTGANANSIIVDRIRIYDNTTQQNIDYKFVDANLKDYINLATNVVEDTYYKDIYTVTYSKGIDGGYVTLTKNSTPHYNLVGFLSQDATGTSYTLDSDEYVYRSIGSMAGTGNIKTVNAGDYTIYGEDKSGVTVSAGQTLNINGGVWDGVSQAIFSRGKVIINNSSFENNAYLLHSGGSVRSAEDSIFEIYNTNFVNNIAGLSGGAIDIFRAESGLIKNSYFYNNQTDGSKENQYGGAIYNGGNTDIIASSFINNKAKSSNNTGKGGAIGNTIKGNISDSIFTGNESDGIGGAIYNSGNIGFSGTNTFTNNKANDEPNDIYNAGTININSGTTTLNSGYVGSETSALTVKSGATLTANAALEVADGGTLTNESGGTLAVSADNLKIDETTNNGILELEGGNVTTKLMGTGRMKLMSGNVRLLSSTPPATTGSLSFGNSSDYVDSILTSSSAASTSDHALVTAGYLSNNYYRKYKPLRVFLIKIFIYFKTKKRR